MRILAVAVVFALKKEMWKSVLLVIISGMYALHSAKIAWNFGWNQMERSAETGPLWSVWRVGPKNRFPLEGIIVFFVSGSKHDHVKLPDWRETYTNVLTVAWVKIAPFRYFKFQS